ncbi:Oligopeptide transport ATP-binding protein OppF [compost metagenome]
MTLARTSMTSPDRPAPVLATSDLEVAYELGPRQKLRAVDRVSFEVARGETLALVGESGCGKSSVAKAVMQLAPMTGGSIRIEGQSVAQLDAAALKRMRQRFQMIFQDPISSLNPKRTVREILEFPLRVNGLFEKTASGQRIREALEIVGLDSQSVLDRYPHEFSGGQCQRISIARSLILDPVLLVCDEPVSALDVSVRAQVLNLLNSLRERLGLSMLFISHDLAVVRNVADRVAVMFLGAICETGDAQDVLGQPAHPYTAALLSAVPRTDPGLQPPRIALRGEMPSPMAPPSGCRFHTRCPGAKEACASSAPSLRRLSDGREVACHFPFSIAVSQPRATASIEPREITV